MAAPKRNPQQILETRARIAELYLKGWSQYAIAGEVGMTREMVKYDLDHIRDEWRKSTLFDFNLAQQTQLAKLDVLEKEMWDAWEKSKANRDVTITRQRRRTLPAASDAVLDNIAEATKRTEQRDADPRFAMIALDCIKERNKILGLYAPTDVNLRTPVGQPPVKEFFYEAVPAQGDAHLVVIGGHHSNGALPAGEVPKQADQAE